MEKAAIMLTTLPSAGGQYQYEALIAEILMKHAGSKYELTAFCYNSFWLNWCKKNGVRYFYQRYVWETKKEMQRNIRFPFLSGIYHRYMTPFGALIRKEKIKILVCGQQGIFFPNYFVKQIYPAHDLMHRYETDFPELSSNYEERELLSQNAAQNAEVILVDSELGKKQFAESYLNGKRKVPKIKVLPYIVPGHVLDGKEEEIEVPSKFIFYPAQFWLHKNHMNLLKAVNLLRERVPDICLVLTGSEKNARSQVEKYVKENHLEENVFIKGFVCNENITYLYKHAAGLVMPTNFGPTNIPPLEAMALGCPVAVSNKYAMPEQVGKAGLLFDPDSPEEIADCIFQMWTKKELRDEMIRQGYCQIQKWTRKDFERAFLKILYAEL